MSELSDAALLYAARGWAVFPLREGEKTPILRGGFQIASTDRALIERWWLQHPGANIGIATGEKSGLIVLDVDRKNGVDGEVALRALIERHGALPDTLEARTPSGGRHLLFAGSGVRNSAGRLGAGLDVRGDGGYIVAAPSATATGVYAWLNEATAAPLPAWVASSAQRDIRAGERNSRLTSEAGLLRARGVDAATIETTLQAANTARCEPPLDAMEVTGIARGVERYSADRPFTDSGNAERLADAYADRLRFCPQNRRWLAWDGKRWRWDEDGVALRAMKNVVRAMYAAASSDPDEARRAARAKWAVKSESAGLLRAAVGLAQSERRLLVDIGQLDSDPWLLGVQNGVLDLNSGQLLPPDPARLITKQALVVYDVDASAPVWGSFLARIFGGYAELIAYVRRAVGYSLTGDTMAKTLFFLHGAGGDNGKSTLIEILRSMLGDYALKTRAETFMLGGSANTGATPERVALRGARLVVASELSDRQRFDESFLKDVTGGIDQIAARNLYEGMIQFRPEFKLWLYGNHKPQLRSDDDAAWRRLHLIPFEVRIPLGEQDAELSEKLIAELPGILNWALAGLADWRRVRLAPPEKVRAAGAAYREEMDDLGRFLEARCARVEGSEVTASELYAAYARWCEVNGQRAMSNVRLSRKLAERGIPRRSLDGRTRWRGLTLRPDDADGF